MMRGALIETSARKIRDEVKKSIALRMIKRGKMTMEEIAEDTDLSAEEVEAVIKTEIEGEIRI